MEWGVFLNHQTVGRQVFHFEREGIVDIVLPSLDSLAGKAIHQVDADIQETGLTQSADSFSGLLRRMATVQKVKSLIAEGLHAHRDTVDGKGG